MINRLGLSFVGMIHFLLQLLVILIIIFLNHSQIAQNKSGIIFPDGVVIKSSNLARNITNRNVESKVRLDFIIAGFPKCGTTSLLYSFLRHNETSITPHEFCAMNGSGGNKSRISLLNQVLRDMESRSNIPLRHGIKCPSAIWDTSGIQLLSDNFKYIKLIVGVRHPVLFFQSFYNYRVTEMYDKNRTERVPSPLELIGSNKWRDVSTDLARFELSLMQLGKSSMSPTELHDLASHGKRLTPTKYKIFLYNIEQLNDISSDRAVKFRADLQHFLRLEFPIAPFPTENRNRVKKSETINICDVRYDELRRIMLRNGNSTVRWLKKFIESDDVFVSDKEFFISLINTWGIDHCLINNVK